MRVAKRYSQYILALCLSLACRALFAQTATTVNLDKMITIDKSESTFESLLDLVSKQSGVVFSFSSKKIASDKVLKIRTGTQTLGNVLQQINSITGLQYKVVGTHIIFLDKPVAVSKSAAPGTRSTLTGRTSQPALSSKSRNHQLNKTDTAGAKSVPSPKVRDGKAGIQPQSASAVTTVDSQANALRRRTTEDSPVAPVDSLKIQNLDSNTSIKDSVVQGGKRLPARDSLASKDSGDSLSAGAIESVTDYAESKTSWLFGAQVSRTAGMENKSESMNATGLGLHVKFERAFSKKFSYTLGIEYNYFTGTYTYNLFSGASSDSIINHFAIAPVFGGMKFHLSNRIYLSAEIGPAMKASSEVRTKLALAPSAGVVFPTNKGAFDLSLRFVHVVRGYGTLESNSLENGGYSFVTLKAAYRINNGRLKGKGAVSRHPSRFASQPFLKNLTKIDVSGQGIAVGREQRLGVRTSLDLSLGIGGGYDITDRVKYKWDINNPAMHLSITPRFFYNHQSRIQSGKLSHLNSGNYFGVRVKYVTRGIGADASIYDTFLMNLHWGLQRAIATRWSFGAHVGAGYAVDVTDLSNPYEAFYPSFDVKFSHILSGFKK